MAFRGSPVIRLAASRIMLIFFLITDFKLGAGICVLAILIFLVGVFRLLRQAGRDLGLDGMASVPSAVSSRMLWGGYILVIAIAVFGGMFWRDYDQRDGGARRRIRGFGRSADSKGHARGFGAGSES